MGFTLRDYQEACVAEAEKRNLLVVLPTNSGKTIIAAELVHRSIGEGKKVCFLAPSGALAIQQANVLLNYTDLLHMDSRRVKGRLGIAIGGDRGERGLADVGWQDAFELCQCVVMKPAFFERALTRGKLRLKDIALLVIDEAHHTRGNSFYKCIMTHFYREDCGPRILALTASPIEGKANAPPSRDQAKAQLRELEEGVRALAWSWADLPPQARLN